MQSGDEDPGGERGSRSPRLSCGDSQDGSFWKTMGHIHSKYLRNPVSMGVPSGKHTKNELEHHHAING